MKKLLLVALLSLNGCALVDAYLMKYDVMEYNHITEIRTLASIAKDKCDDPLAVVGYADNIANKTLNFKNYTQHLPHDEPAANAAIKLNEIAQGLNEKYKNDSVSPMFCKIKLESIEKSAETMQTTIGAKPR